MADVFLSYGHHDREFVEWLDQQLQTNNISCWWDKELGPGVQWSTKLETELTAATSVIVVWSKNSYDHEFVRSEARRALNEGKLFQLSLDGSPVPLGFGERQYVKVSSSNADLGTNNELTRLIDEIKSRMPPQHPRTNALRRVLARHFGVELDQYLANGEIAEIWLGKIGFRTVTVKVVRGLRIEEAVGKSDRKEQFKNMLRNQLHELRSFNRRHHLRIYDLKLIPSDLPPEVVRDLGSELVHLKDDWIVVSDYTPGMSLRDLTLEWAKAGNRVSSERIISDKTISIVRQLAAALWEGESHNLQLMRLTPEDIYIELNEQGDDPLVRFAPLSFTQLVEYAVKIAKWTDESGPYIAPELWEQKLPLFATTGAKSDELSSRIDHANQFAFGMIIWFMLKGELGFKSDPSDATFATIKKFERWVRDDLPAAIRNGSVRSVKRRALYRIVERLVRFNRDDRWKSMQSVSLLLGAFTVDSDRAELFSIVKRVYQDVCVSPDGSLNDIFYKGFYDKLFRSSKKLKKFFADIDMERQRRILHEALGQLLNFRQPHGGEPTTLTRFTLPHKRLGLFREDYRIFGKALIDTFEVEMQRYSKGDREFFLAALELVIWPGIYYFIEKCCEPRS
jgi:TIR domain